MQHHHTVFFNPMPFLQQVSRQTSTSPFSLGPAYRMETNQPILTQKITYHNTHINRLEPQQRQKEYSKFANIDIDKENRRRSIWNEAPLVFRQNPKNAKQANNNQGETLKQMFQRTRRQDTSRNQLKCDDIKNNQDRLVFRAKSDTNLLKLKNLAKKYEYEFATKPQPVTQFFKKNPPICSIQKQYKDNEIPTHDKIKIQAQKIQAQQQIQQRTKMMSQVELPIQSKIKEFTQEIQDLILMLENGIKQSKLAKISKLISEKMIELVNCVCCKQEGDTVLKYKTISNGPQCHKIIIDQSEPTLKKPRQEEQNSKSSVSSAYQPLNFELTCMEIQNNAIKKSQQIINQKQQEEIRLDDFSWMKEKKNDNKKIILKQICNQSSIQGELNLSISSGQRHPKQ